MAIKGEKNLFLTEWNRTHNKSGPEANSWKGDKVSYSGLHKWIVRELGQPSICQICKDKTLKPRQYHWSNMSRQYSRDLKDWQRLCVSCHKKYDLKLINNPTNFRPQ